MNADHDGNPDSQVMASTLSQLFSGMANAVTTQGGLAERFLGSCLVAVFGVRDLHEDDEQLGFLRLVGRLGHRRH